MLSPDNTANVLAQSLSGYSLHDITGIYLNISFQNGQLNLTTGISYTIFSTDRTLEQEWDLLLQKFLFRHNISFDKP